MTTIILTIIGILLAAAAALMVIFYGGDAFNSGSTGAAANTFQNAGTNVISAVQLYKAEKGVATGLTLTSLKASTCTTGGACLKEDPALPTGATHGLSGAQYTVTGVARDVCQRINKNLKIATDPLATDTTTKMACALPASGTGTFFANA